METAVPVRAIAATAATTPHRRDAVTRLRRTQIILNDAPGDARMPVNFDRADIPGGNFPLNTFRIHPQPPGSLANGQNVLLIHVSHLHFISLDSV